MATPYKMKGSPMQRNFGVGSPLHDHKKDKYGNVIKHGGNKGNVWSEEFKALSHEEKLAKKKATEKSDRDERLIAKQAGYKGDFTHQKKFYDAD